MNNQIIHGIIGVTIASINYHFLSIVLEKHTKHSYKENKYRLIGSVVVGSTAGLYLWIVMNF